VDVHAATAPIVTAAASQPPGCARPARSAPAGRPHRAIHLATARALGAPRLSFVAYDKRLLTAAEEHGLDALAPGS
jgi:hypothetical protein